MGKKKLLVEGKNDQIVISTLCARHGIWVYNKEKPVEAMGGRGFDFECKNKLSIEKMLNLASISSELKESDLETIGFVMDADDDLEARWRSLANFLIRLGYPVLPAQPDPAGTVVALDETRTLGVWIMPNNRLQGMLEDFVGFLIPEGDSLWLHAKRCVADIAESDRPFGIAVAKANIHTWLAWREEPGTPMGSAISNTLLNSENAEALAFIAWIKRLFGI